MQKEQSNFRIDAEAKMKAYEVLQQMGVKPTDAVNMLMHHIAHFKELPFKPRIPNEETEHTFAQTDANKALTAYDDVAHLFADLDL